MRLRAIQSSSARSCASNEGVSGAVSPSFPHRQRMTSARNFRRRSRAAQPRPLNARLGQIRRSIQPQHAGPTNAPPTPPHHRRPTLPRTTRALLCAKRGLRRPATCDRARPRPAKAVSSLAQAANLCKRLTPTEPPPHHQATQPPESPSSPTETLPHRHAHGPATPAPAKPQLAPRETDSAKQAMPRLGSGSAKPSHG